MGDNPLVSMEVDKELVAEVLKKQIGAAIVSNLGGEKDLIAKAVATALEVKVDRNGGVSSYERDNKYDYLEVLATKAIQEAAQVAVKEWLAKNSDKIHKAVMTELNKPRRALSLAKAFADTVAESVKCNWSTNVYIDFEKKKDKSYE